MPSSSSSLLVSDLPDIFRTKIAPRDRLADAPRLVVAQPAFKDIIVPESVRVSRRRLLSKRLAVRGPRPFSNISAVTARWPKDGLMEDKSVPKLAYVVQGHTDYQVGECVIHCGEGHFILVPPGAPHPDGFHPHLDEARQQAGEYCCFVWFQPWTPGVRCWICHSRGREHHHGFQGQYLLVFNSQANELLAMMGEEAAKKSENSVQACEHLLQVLLIALDRELQGGHFLLSRADLSLREAGALPGAGHDPIEQAKQYIRSHLSEALTIETVVRKVHISRTQFIGRFRAETGQSFVEFLTDCRLANAKTMLRESDQSLFSIGACSGFRSYSYFCTLFRRREGMTPGQYRIEARRQAGNRRAILD